MATALAACPRIAALPERATVPSAADLPNATGSIVIRRRPIADRDARFANLARVRWVGVTIRDVFAANPAMWPALLTTCRATALGWRATFPVATDAPGRLTARCLVIQHCPVKAVRIRSANLAIAGRVPPAAFDRLPLDFTLVRAVHIRALNPIAALGRRATVAVATDAPVTTEESIAGICPAVRIAPRVAILAGILGVDLTVIEGINPDHALAPHAPVRPAALIRPATITVAALAIIGAALLPTEGVAAVADNPADASAARRVPMHP